MKTMGDILMQIAPAAIRRRAEARPNLQRVLGNASWLFADRVIRLGVGLFVGIWIARYLGPEQYGVYSYAIAFVSLFMPIATLGLDGIVVRNIVRSPNSANEVLGAAFVLKFLGGIAAITLAVLLIGVVRPGDQAVFGLVSIIAIGVLFQSLDVIDLLYQSQMRSKYTVIAKDVVFALATLAKVYLIKIQASVEAFAWVWLAEIAMGSIGLAIMYLWKGHRFSQWRLNVSQTRFLLGESWPLALSGVAIMIYVRIDQVMLGRIIGDQAVGIYSAAVRLSELWYFIPVAIAASATPLIIRARGTDRELYHMRLQKVFNLMAVLAYAIAIPITIFADYIVIVLFGQEYIASGPVLRIYIWQGLFVFQGVARGIWIVAEGHSRMALLTTSFGALINILLNLFLIPRYGPIGAALATIVSYASSDYLIFVLYPSVSFRQIGLMMTKALTLSFLYQRKRAGV